MVAFSLQEKFYWKDRIKRLPEDWCAAGGIDTKVCIIDSGLPSKIHKDLDNSFVEIRNFSSNDGLDYTENDNHMLSCAGIIAAHGTLVGLAPYSKLYGARVLNKNNSDAYSVVGAIKWAMNCGVDVINLSFGTKKRPHPKLQDVLREAVNKGIVIIAAAGNNGRQNTELETMDWPARFPEVISIGSLNKDNERATFSSTGCRLDYLAPGSEILSLSYNDRYDYYSGSSLSCAVVTGVVALLISHLKYNKLPVNTTTVKNNLVKHVVALNEQGWNCKEGIGKIEFNRGIK